MPHAESLPARVHTGLAYVGLGANLGKGLETLPLAWARLGSLVGIRVERLSSPFHSAPVDMASPHWFTNAVGRLRSTLGPEALLARLHGVETAFGRERDRAGGHQDRPLDLDLLLYDDLVIASDLLVLPHPRMSERLFVLEPLAELAPDLRHPRLHLTMAELLRRLRERVQDQHLSRQQWPSP